MYIPRQTKTISFFRISLYHFPTFANPASIASLTGANLRVEANTSQLVRRHSKIGSTFETVGYVADENSAWALRGSYIGFKKGIAPQKLVESIPRGPRISTPTKPILGFCYKRYGLLTLCIPDTSDRPGYFLISLSNLATPLITYGAPCITLLCSTFITTLLHIWRRPYPYFRISCTH